MKKLVLFLIIMTPILSYAKEYESINAIKEAWKHEREELLSLVEEGKDESKSFYILVHHTLSPNGHVPQGVLNYPLEFGNRTYRECLEDKEKFDTHQPTTIFKKEKDQEILKDIRVGLKKDSIRILDKLLSSPYIERFHNMRNEDEALRALWDAYAEEATLGHNNVYEKARFEQMSVAGVFKLQQMVMSSLGTLAMHYPLATATNMKQAIRWVKNGIFYIINYNPESTTCEYWGGTGKTDPEFKRKISELEKIAIRMVEKREEKRRRERSLAVIENRMIYSYYERSTLSSYERGSTTITTSSSSSSSSSSSPSSSSFGSLVETESHVDSILSYRSQYREPIAFSRGTSFDNKNDTLFSLSSAAAIAVKLIRYAPK